MVYRKLSIIIPVYNEEVFIKKVISEVVKAKTAGLKKEIIIVDDGSTDKTAERVKKADLKSADNIEIKKIFRKKNEGKGAAVKAAVLKSSGDLVLIQDADLEYNPADYPVLLEPFLKNQADAVFGSRFITDRPHRVLYFWHSVINIFLTTLSNMLTNMNITDMETGFKVFKGDLIREIAPKLKSRRFGFEPEITARLAKVKGIRIYEVGISYSGRTYEEGKKIGWTDGLRAIAEIIRFNLFEG